MMHAGGGRPPLSYTPTGNRAPYAPPGQARPPRQGGPPGGKGPSARMKARDRWSMLFMGPGFLEAGPSNRLVLSLRSCVPAEVDSAMERIIQVSSIDPDLLRFNELPGLLDGLLGLIRDYLERRIQDRKGGAQSLTVVMNSEAREIMRRRAAEASLVLRNLALEKKNLEPLLESKRLRRMIVQSLEEGEIEGPEGEETTELRLYLLEVLELIGESIPLAIPGHAIALDAPTEGGGGDEEQNRPPPKPEPLDAPSVRLFPLLVNLTTSQDRALLLASYRCLTVLSLNEKSDAIFSFLAYTKLPPLPKPSPNPIETAIKLLPLQDAELSSVILDFIYQHTLLPSNSAYFCTRPELLPILKLVCSKLEIGARADHVETEILSTPGEAAIWYKANYPNALKNLKPNTGAQARRKPLRMPTGEPLLSEEEMMEIVANQEPDRAIEWMHRMYEIDPDSSITQVSLWTAYKTQFETILSDPKYPIMLAAQEVIRLSGQAFPSAVPTIVDDQEGRKFIINGLKPRQREAQAGECGWQNCPVPAGHDSPLAFHQHVYNTHLALSPPRPRCCWSNCTYSVPPTSSPSLALAKLTLHTRIHLPSLAPSTSNELLNSDTDLPPAKLHHVRYHAQVDDRQEATGPSFLACLVLRNLSRAAKLAREATLPRSTSDSSTANSREPAGGGRISVASGNAAIGRLAEGEQSIFEAFAIAEEGAGGQSVRKSGGKVLQEIEKPDWTIAEPAIEALCDVEEEILRMALSNVVLGKYLVEVVVSIEEFKRGREARRNREEGGDVKMEE
ncbi:hypothetical protein JCM16303_003634 [Sporobolomyces ruberrimus]